MYVHLKSQTLLPDELSFREYSTLNRRIYCCLCSVCAAATEHPFQWPAGPQNIRNRGTIDQHDSCSQMIGQRTKGISIIKPADQSYRYGTEHSLPAARCMENTPLTLSQQLFPQLLPARSESDLSTHAATLLFIATSAFSCMTTFRSLSQPHQEPHCTPPPRKTRLTEHAVCSSSPAR